MMFFSLGQKTAARSIRDNNAAWVAGPSRICFCGLSLKLDLSSLRQMHFYCARSPSFGVAPQGEPWSTALIDPQKGSVRYTRQE